MSSWSRRGEYFSAADSVGGCSLSSRASKVISHGVSQPESYWENKRNNCLNIWCGVKLFSIIPTFAWIYQHLFSTILVKGDFFFFRNLLRNVCATVEKNHYSTEFVSHLYGGV